ncbi:MAG: hypothetical protein ABSG73_03710 [Candidatus Aminicenantales bacterium]|jgi:hypothetical protein
MNRESRGKRSGFPIGAVVLLALLVSGSCKWGTPDYTLNVVLEAGVTGTPEAGKHAYKELTTVTLNYTAVNTLETVEVFLNGTIRNTGTGSVIMYGDGYELKANVIDIRASYKIALTYTDTTITAPDPFIITLTGPDRLSGTFTDERGYHGTWTASSNALLLSYWDWNFYVLAGTVYNMGYSSGSFTGGGQSGTWTAVKQ